MPQAPVDDKGNVLFYEDTGAPPGSTDYNTIVLIHGIIFHGAIFRPLIPYAHKNNLRLVFLNMRDYPGSSPYTAEEVTAMASKDLQDQANAIRGIGRQVAAFMVYFIRKYSIPAPKVVSGQQTGGIALLTWSLSNILSMALLGNAHSLSKEVKEVLETYWHTMVMYDPSVTTLGEPPAAGAYSTLRDMTMTLEERGVKFASWVSSYFPAVTDLSTTTDATLRQRQTYSDTPEYKATLPEHRRKSTVDNMSAAQIAGVTEYGVLERSNEAMRTVRRDVYRTNTMKALWEPENDPDHSGAPRITFANLRVVFMWFDMSMGDCVWAAKVSSDHRDAASPTRRRDVQFVHVPGANHFPHWDEPERITGLIVKYLRGISSNAKANL